MGPVTSEIRISSMAEQRSKPLADLYQAHWKGLCRYLRARFGAGPPDPEDVAQTAFARYAAADQSQIENPQAFLYATAQRIIIDYRRHAQRSGEYERDLAGSALEDSLHELSPENVLLQTERFQILSRVLEGMPVKRRRLVLLNRFEGLSYVELGHRFGMSAENVRKNIERALAECLRELTKAQRPSLPRFGSRS